MKIIAIIGVKGLPGFGGSARATEYLIEGLKNQYKFYVYMLRSYTDMTKVLIHENIEYKVFKDSKSKKLNTFVYYLKCLLHSLFYVNHDFIHLNHAESGFITPFLRIKYKVLLTVRGVFNKEDEKFGYLTNLFFKISERINYKTASIIISVSKPDIYHIQQLTNKEIIHIPNGVSVKNFKIAKVTLPEDYILFSAGRIYSIKGLHLLIDALNMISYQGKVLVVGDLNQVEDYKKLILTSSSNLDVEFIDIIKDISVLLAYIKNAKYFVFPSLFEAMSNMLLEVAAMETPLICSDIPSNISIFNEDEVLFFQSNNAIDLAKKIEWANNNNAKMKLSAAIALQKVKNNHSREKICLQYSEIYNWLS